MTALPGSMLNAIIYFIIAVVTFACLSCDSTEAPLEAPSPDTYITLVPRNSSVINQPSVTFQWIGSNRLVTEFSYRCVPEQESWSEWFTGTSITLNYLDQGEYVFEVRGRYRSGKEDDAPDQRSFTVDIPGPGMLLQPFKLKAAAGEEFSIRIQADDVEDVMFAHLILKFSPAQVEALDATPGEIFQSSPPVFFKTIDNSEGVVDINMTTIGAEPTRIIGTGSVAIVRFKPISPGESKMYFAKGSEFRNSSGKPIDIVSSIGSVVEISDE